MVVSEQGGKQDPTVEPGKTSHDKVKEIELKAVSEGPFKELQDPFIGCAMGLALSKTKTVDKFAYHAANMVSLDFAVDLSEDNDPMRESLKKDLDESIYNQGKELWLPTIFIRFSHALSRLGLDVSEELESYLQSTPTRYGGQMYDNELQAELAEKEDTKDWAGLARVSRMARELGVEDVNVSDKQLDKIHEQMETYANEGELAKYTQIAADALFFEEQDKPGFVKKVQVHRRQILICLDAFEMENKFVKFAAHAAAMKELNLLTPTM